MIDLDNLSSYIVYIVRSASLEQWQLGSLVNLKKEYVKVTTILNDGSALFDILDYLGNNKVIGRIWFNDKYIMLVKNEVERSLLYNGWPEGVDLYSVYEQKVKLPEVPAGILKIPTDFKV
jgi:hypothetical protein